MILAKPYNCGQCKFLRMETGMFEDGVGNDEFIREFGCKIDDNLDCCSNLEGENINSYCPIKWEEDKDEKD